MFNGRDKRDEQTEEQPAHVYSIVSGTRDQRDAKVWRPDWSEDQNYGLVFSLILEIKRLDSVSGPELGLDFDPEARISVSAGQIIGLGLDVGLNSSV